jgi:hypothetical protein
VNDVRIGVAPLPYPGAAYEPVRSMSPRALCMAQKAKTLSRMVNPRLVVFRNIHRTGRSMHVFAHAYHFVGDGEADDRGPRTTKCQLAISRGISIDADWGIGKRKCSQKPYPLCWPAA